MITIHNVYCHYFLGDDISSSSSSSSSCSSSTSIFSYLTDIFTLLYHHYKQAIQPQSLHYQI